MSTFRFKGVKSAMKQVRFATAGALNGTAFEARKQLNKSLRRDFTIRRKFTATGTRVQKARKSTLVAKVGTIRDYLEDHVTGGVRTISAIPTRKRRRNPRSVVRRAQWPGASRGGRFFFVESDGLPEPFRRHAGNRERLLFRRGAGRSRRLNLLWVIPPTQRITKRWPFESVLVKTVREQFAPQFVLALDRALRTAR